jgi:hypothetical protein
MTLISNGDGTYTAAPLDVLMILHDVVAGTYHAAFFEEAPLPGNATSVRSVRLRCRMHRLRGAPSLEGARMHLDELAEKIRVPHENVWHNKLPYPWDRRPRVTLVVDNWRSQLLSGVGEPWG